jgi:serine/threonine protein kinase
MKIEPGQTLNAKYQYRIVEILHQEADSALCLARLLKTGDLVDILTLAESASQHFTARFQRETELLNEIDSVHVPNIVDYGTTEEIFFVVTENVAGLLLTQVIATAPSRTIETIQACAYFRQLAEALVELDRHGITHGEIRPQNIVVSSDGVIKLLGFGAIRNVAMGDDANMAASLPYVAPELLQVDHPKIDVRADIFSVGAVAYEMLCGHPPFDGRHVSDLIRMIVMETRPPASHYNWTLSPAIDTLLTNCMQADPRQRYQTPQDLLIAIDSVPAPAPEPAATAFLTVSPAKHRPSRLVLVSGQGARYVLGDQGGLLGRNDGPQRAAIAVDLSREEHGRTVSRRQAELRRVQGQWVIIPMPGTTNPTLQNGRALKPGAICPLNIGDELQIGGVKLMVQSEDAQPGVPT